MFLGQGEHGTIKNSPCERIIELSAFSDMLQEEVAIRGEIRIGIPLLPGVESEVDCPVSIAQSEASIVALPMR
jgi:hypothetical protein